MVPRIAQDIVTFYSPVVDSKIQKTIRDRPFNVQGRGDGGGMFFCFVQKFLEYLFFCRAKREFFFQNITLGYITKTLNQIIFFSSTKIRIFFQQYWETEYFWKLNGPSLIGQWIFQSSFKHVVFWRERSINNAENKICVKFEVC